MEDQVAKKSFKSSFFPESIDKIPLCKADKSIPAVESVALDERALHELGTIHILRKHFYNTKLNLTNYFFPSKQENLFCNILFWGKFYAVVLIVNIKEEFVKVLL